MAKTRKHMRGGTTGDTLTPETVKNTNVNDPVDPDNENSPTDKDTNAKSTSLDAERPEDSPVKTHEEILNTEEETPIPTDPERAKMDDTIDADVREAAQDTLDTLKEVEETIAEVKKEASMLATDAKLVTNYATNEVAGIINEMVVALKDEGTQLSNLPNVTATVDQLAHVAVILSGPISGKHAQKLLRQTGTMVGIIVDSFPTEKLGNLVGQLSRITGEAVAESLRIASRGLPGAQTVAALDGVVGVATTTAGKVTPIATKAAVLFKSLYDKIKEAIKTIADGQKEISNNLNSTISQVGGAKRKISRHRRERWRITRRLNKHIKQFNATRRRS